MEVAVAVFGTFCLSEERNDVKYGWTGLDGVQFRVRFLLVQEAAVDMVDMV